MDRSEKLAVARRKLKKFQSKGSPAAGPGRVDDWTSGRSPATPTTPVSSSAAHPPSESPSPPQPKTAKLSSTEGLREMSQEISQLLSRPSLPPSKLTGHAHQPQGGHAHLQSPQVNSSHLTEDTASLERQVQVHAQTIDVLVSEKTALQSNVSSLEQLLDDKKRECLQLTFDLQAARQSLHSVEREKSELHVELSQRVKVTAESNGQLSSLRQTVERLRSSLEEQQQENTELISKITSQAAELSRFQEINTELQSKLNMSELLVQQLSSNEPPPPPPDSTSSKMDELHSEIERLKLRVGQVGGERDQALSDLAALRDAMMLQQEEGAKKIAELRKTQTELELQLSALSSELSRLQDEKGSLEEQLSSGAVQVQESIMVSVKSVEGERDRLREQYEQQVRNNGQLSRMNEEMERRVGQLEHELARTQEEMVDQHSLLTTMHQDKETISRAMSQNKELKGNLAELQDAFVRLTQQNMELASDLETERHRVREMNRSNEESVKEEEGLKVEYSRLKEEFERVVSELDNARQEGEGVTCRDGSLLKDEHVQTEDSELSTGIEQPAEAASDQVSGEALGQEFNNLSYEQVTTLQRNFTALQQRFTMVMTEKAELMERLQEEEHRILQLAGETDTIGEYIALYQTQREALRAKFTEKDQFIQQLVTEREDMKGKLRDLQNLVRQLLSERPPYDLAPSASRRYPHPPPLSEIPTDLPIHLRPQTSVQDHSNRMDHTPSPDGNETMEQIMTILDQLETARTSGHEFVPCTCCTGQLISV